MKIMEYETHKINQACVPESSGYYLAKILNSEDLEHQYQCEYLATTNKWVITKRRVINFKQKGE